MLIGVGRNFTGTCQLFGLLSLVPQYCCLEQPLNPALGVPSSGGECAARSPRLRRFPDMYLVADARESGPGYIGVDAEESVCALGEEAGQFPVEFQPRLRAGRPPRTGSSVS